MASNQRRQRLLKQLSRLRELEHRAAATRASEALGEAHRSDQLAARAKALADGHGDLSQVDTAQDLAGRFLSGSRLRGIAADVTQRAKVARSVADERLLQERQARQKLDRLEEKRAQLLAQQNELKIYGETGGSGKLARNVNSNRANG